MRRRQHRLPRASSRTLSSARTTLPHTLALGRAAKPPEPYYRVVRRGSRRTASASAALKARPVRLTESHREALCDHSVPGSPADRAPSGLVTNFDRNVVREMRADAPGVAGVGVTRP